MGLEAAGFARFAVRRKPACVISASGVLLDMGIHLESLLVQQLPVFLSAQAPMVKRLSSIFAYGFLYRTWVP